MSTTPVLGITVSSQTVVGVLVDQREDGPAVVRTMFRSRTAHVSANRPSAQAAGGFAPQGGTDDDPDVLFAPQNGGGDLFLASEFSIGSGDAGTPGVVGSPAAPKTVELEVKELVAECAQAGFPDVTVVFSSGLPNLGVHEMVLGDEGSGSDSKEGRKSRKSRRGSSRRDMLVRRLAEEVDGPVDQDAVVLLSMTPDQDRRERVLAVYAKPDEPILPTLRMLENRGRHMPAIDLVDTEISLLLGLGRMAAPQDEPGRQRRLVLRVGVEDAVALYLDGQQLHHFEKLRSITVYDPPETIGSRILLLQDEYGIGEAGEILVLSEENEEALISFLADFFPDSEVRSASSLLPPYPGDPEYRWSRQAALAATVALRVLHEREAKSLFESVNLIPKVLRKRRRREKRTVAWQVYASFAVLFGLSLFFVARFMHQKYDIEMAQLRLSQYSPEEIERSVSTLEGRIDSIQTRVDGYIKALDILDSLLIGSDRWSRAMEHTANQAASVSGVWIETWLDQGTTLELTGTATSREQIVRLATRMDGVIEDLTFSEIRDWPVYSFRMTVPLQSELPEAARFLREQANTAAPVTGPAKPADGTAAPDASSSE